MPRYYCDYCDTYLTHDSPSVRKQHNAGYKHKANVRNYYQQFEEQQTQQIIDQRIKEHLGQAAAFGQVGAAYNQHLLAQRPRLPGIPPPMMPIAGNSPVPVNPALMRPPVLARPMTPGVPGYPSAPPMAPMMAPPGAPTAPVQANNMQMAPVSAPTSIPGSAPASTPGSTGPLPASNSAPSMVPPVMYQPSAAPANYQAQEPNR